MTTIDSKETTWQTASPTVSPTPSYNPSIIIGLTGGIGSGKTVASDHFGALGVPIIDTDIIARLVVEPGQAALAQLVEVFGSSILKDDGYLNRDALRELAFSNTENKAKLDEITHPAIRNETMRQLANVTFPYCIVVVPLLTKDSPFQGFMQRIIAVTCSEETRVTRVMQRSKLSREAVIKIISTQLTDQQRLEFADDVIANDGTIDDVKKAVEELHEKYLLLGEPPQT